MKAKEFINTNIQSKNGKITIPFHNGKDINIKTFNTILKQAGLK